MSDDEERPKLTDVELKYAATSRCRCGAGLAYPLDHKLSMAIRGWVCSRVLKGDGQGTDQTLAAFGKEPPAGEHDFFPWAFFKIREEGSVNDRVGTTTRPAGTALRTIRTATCPKCKHVWESEPYSASGPAGRHWEHGPCPSCGHANPKYYDKAEWIDDRGRDIVIVVDGEVTP